MSQSNVQDELQANQNRLTWRKATASGGNGGNCVELAAYENGVALRDSKDEGKGPVHLFTKAELRAFIDGCQAGEFDDFTAES